MQSQRQRIRFSLGGNLTPAVKILILINVFVFVCLNLVKGHSWGGLPYTQVLLDILGLNPEELWSNYTVWQLVTYAFLHIAFFHLLFNMLALWWFGADIEHFLGTKQFVRYYFFTAIGAGLVSAILGIPTIGASGAVYGLLLAYGLMFPNRVLYLYFVIPIKAKYCVFFFGLLELFALVGSGPSQINHAAHLSGIFFGLIWFYFPRRRISLMDLWENYKRTRMRKKLKIIKDKSPMDVSNDDHPTIH